MKIDCIADLHGYEPKLPGGDLLILAGDYTARDSLLEWGDFFYWLKQQKYRKKILISGNHDNFLQSAYPKSEKESYELREVKEFLEQMGEENEDFEYLCDSGTEFEGYKIWGSPWSVWFSGVNPNCKAFMANESKLEKKFKKIPKDVDILITHTPPYLVLDESRDGRPCGSQMLRQQLDTRIKPILHVFGHIHEEGCKEILFKHVGVNTICVNASYVDENYRERKKFMTVTL